MILDRYVHLFYGKIASPRCNYQSYYRLRFAVILLNKKNTLTIILRNNFNDHFA
jgi:hypothetical protein